MRRVLAVVAALGLIAGGLLLRSRLGTATDGGTTATAGGRVVCARELAAVCADLQKKHPELTFTDEDAQTTATALSGPQTDQAMLPDLWLTYRPMTGIVEDNRSRAGLSTAFGEASPVLARSPLVIVARNDRRAALQASCGADLSWKCLGDKAGTPWSDVGGQATWGDVKVGIPAADTTAIGALLAGEASASYFGRTDYAANDFVDPGFTDWLGRLARSSRAAGRSASTPLDLLLTQRGSFDFAGSPEAIAGPAVATSRDKNDLTILYPSPLATADVVAVPVAGSEAGGRVKKVFESDEAAQALADHGWRVDGHSPANGVGSQPLPSTDGLPRAGVLSALQTQWSQASR